MMRTKTKEEPKQGTKEAKDVKRAKQKKPLQRSKGNIEKRERLVLFFSTRLVAVVNHLVVANHILLVETRASHRHVSTGRVQ